MPKKPFARISITLPAEVLRAADREAKRVGRSRSWVIAEAIRRGLPAEGVAEGGAAPAAVRAPAVRETAPHPYATDVPGLDPFRKEQLRRDLELTPAERLLASDDAVRLGELAHPRPALRQVIFFDDYLEYLKWKDVGRLFR